MMVETQSFHIVAYTGNTQFVVPIHQELNPAWVLCNATFIDFVRYMAVAKFLAANTLFTGFHYNALIILTPRVIATIVNWCIISICLTCI